MADFTFEIQADGASLLELKLGQYLPGSDASSAAAFVSASEAAASAALAVGHYVFVAPNGYSGAVPQGYALVTQDETNTATVNMAAGNNNVDVNVGGLGTVRLLANASPFTADLIDGDGGLANVTIVRVPA